MLIKHRYSTKINESMSKDFSINKNGVLTKYKGKDSNVVIPDGVTKIGEYAFFMCNVKSVKIPNSVKSIGDCAFDGCHAKSINISNGVEIIGKDAFSGCSNLKKIMIPRSVKIICDNAFAECESLESVTISNGVENIGDYVFAQCHTLKSITIPNSVKSIGGGVFAACENLRTINMPNPIITCNEFSLGVYDLTKFNGVDISDTNDLSYFYMESYDYKDKKKTLILPNDEYMYCDNINGEECYVRHFKSAYNEFFIVVYSDMTREVFYRDGSSVTEGVRLVDILDIYDLYPVGVRKDGKQTFLTYYSPPYEHIKWFDECYTDMKGNLYIDGKKVMDYPFQH